MSRNLELALRLTADATRFMAGMAKGEGGLRKLGSAAKRELDAVGNAFRSVEGRLAQLGIGVSALAVGAQSANLDKDLVQLKLTAGATVEEMNRMRDTLFSAQSATGQTVDELKGGVDALIAGGQSMAEATATVRPMAETLAVAKTNADALAKAMGVAGKMFDIDLSQADQARLLLDRMVVAGRAGNAELENLPDVFARVGPAARSANLDINQTLALVETLSLYEPNAERLATLADSTLRVFNNAAYMKDAAKAAKVRFFDAEGNRRGALDIITDIKKVYDQFKTDKQRASFIDKAFGKADQDTRKGMQNLLDDKALGNLSDILRDIKGAGGTIARDLPEAISNSVDQVGRLRGELRKAADDFARPVNDTLSGLIKWGLDSKDNGGLGLSGNDILLGGAVGAAGIFGTARYGGKALKGLAGKLGGTAAGVATGKALEEMAGVTPVYVVNMPGDGLGGAGPLDKVAGRAGGLGAAGRLGLQGLALAGAGAAGYGAGTLLSSRIDDQLSQAARRQTTLGSMAYDALHGDSESTGILVRKALGEANPMAGLLNRLYETIQNARQSEVNGKITVRIESDGRPRVTELQSAGVDLSTSTYTGGQGF
ncbi:phage tail tape measure protein [Pseudomonas sp. 2023EL-01195]|uniref:phage tail tape measure protein n=2 Tax=Pseudomonadaceae TaxID=135621 RepID=UPI00296AAA21|nr:phage tail tape measure protein [Pseudomonas sp. 2023EL-01195]MDW3711886.1 phage tail tape measure protein [Pseudomonas sp. 2023EL-01195]